MTNEPSHLEALEQRLGCRWSSLAKARVCSEARLEELNAALGSSYVSSDVSVVVFGSLARRELTSKSDPDWTLLVDGQADSNHLETSRQVKGIVEPLFGKEPGREQTFGGLAFSHELVHQIGGDADTNKNTTRRILLLLESEVIGRAEAYDRVITAVLQRYLLEDRTFAERTAPNHVPRFLLNDFARYWRTMAVDFAYKARTRSGRGAILRNVKLRMSRKLIYVSGLLSCFACELGLARPDACDECSWSPAECVACLKTFMTRPPLEIVAHVLEHIGARADQLARNIMGSYDCFIGLLDDEDKRERLENLDADQLESDEVYAHARRLSHTFRDGILGLFFDIDELKPLTRTYGVF